jgi:hypothetical protein
LAEAAPAAEFTQLTQSRRGPCEQTATPQARALLCVVFAFQLEPAFEAFHAERLSMALAHSRLRI